MSARDVAIDTLTFDDLVKLALEDLPGASSGRWTLHGPVDPGIAILELLAWQFEQRLFMADQITEPIVRSSLRLLGVPDPAPAAAASTVLSITSPNATQPLPAGTAFALERDPRARRFAIERDVWALPVTGVRASGRLLGDGDALDFELEHAGAKPAAGATLSLLVEVAAAPGVAASWQAGAVEVDPPAQLRWSAVGPDGALAQVDVVDTTGALRRSGLLRVTWPEVWNRSGAGSPRLRATAVAASYTEPVEILGVHPNAVVARHSVACTADVGDQVAAFLPLPGQVVKVPDAGSALCDGDGDVVLTVTELDGVAHRWRGARSLVGSGPGDRVVVVDRARGELRFGDGRSGRILRPRSPVSARLRYHLGAGGSGSLGRLSSWAQAGGAAVAVNPVPAQGGADEEPLDAARRRAADALHSRDRTVTERDTRELAESTPGIGLRRADVSPAFHPAFPCRPVPGALTVTIVPHADRDADPVAWTPAPLPDAGALATTRKRLENGRLLAQEIAVLAPVYRRVTVDVSIAGQLGAPRELVVDALRRYLDPLVGGPEGDGWPFGGPVRPSALAGIVQRAIGVESTVTRLAAALDGGPPSDCSDLAIGPRELVFLGAATVAFVAALPGGSGLR
jgi:hypothetical protein